VVLAVQIHPLAPVVLASLVALEALASLVALEARVVPVAPEARAVPAALQSRAHADTLQRAGRLRPARVSRAAGRTVSSPR
jgi:hypothetical protein